MTKFEYMEYIRKSGAVKREVSKRLKEKDCEFSDLELKLLNFNHLKNQRIQQERDTNSKVGLKKKNVKTNGTSLVIW